MEDKINKYKQENGSTNMLLIFNSPNNPTRYYYEPDELKHLSKIFKKHDITLFSDEIYLELTFDKTKNSISNYYNKTIRGTSLSKTYATGGWRCGWLIFPEILNELYNKMNIYSSSIYSCISEPLIFVMKGILDNNNQLLNYNNKVINIYKKIIDYVYSNLKENTKLIISKAKGAWYLFLDFRNYVDKFKKIGINNSDELNEYLCKKWFISVSGNSFSYKNLGIRISCIDFDVNTIYDNFDSSITRIKKGVDLLIDILSK